MSRGGFSPFVQTKNQSHLQATRRRFQLRVVLIFGYQFVTFAHARAEIG